MQQDTRRLQQEIAPVRRDIRLISREMQQLIDADLDCSGAACLLVRKQADLTELLAKQERLTAKEIA